MLKLFFSFFSFFFFSFLFLFFLFFFFLPQDCFRNILSWRLASQSPSRMFKMSLGFTKKENRNTAAIFRHMPNKKTITVHWLDSTQNSSKIPKNLDFEETFIQRHLRTLYRTRLIYTIMTLLTTMHKCWPIDRQLSLAKRWFDTSLRGSSPVSSVTFPSISYVIYMEKLISDKQRVKHVYPVRC